MFIGLLLIPKYLTATNITEEELNEFTVRIFIISKENDIIGGCTGVIVENYRNSAIVLTAKHCICDDTYAIINNQVMIKKVDDSFTDLQLLYFNQQVLNKRPVEISNYVPRYNEKIYTLGMPSNKKRFYMGKFLHKRNNSEDIYKLLSISGCSGSGIFTANKQLVGIISQDYYWEDNDGKIKHYTIAVSLKNIKRFLKMNRCLK